MAIETPREVVVAVRACALERRVVVLILSNPSPFPPRNPACVCVGVGVVLIDSPFLPKAPMCVGVNWGFAYAKRKVF